MWFSFVKGHLFKNKMLKGNEIFGTTNECFETVLRIVACIFLRLFVQNSTIRHCVVNTFFFLILYLKVYIRIEQSKKLLSHYNQIGHIYCNNSYVNIHKVIPIGTCTNVLGIQALVAFRR